MRMGGCYSVDGAMCCLEFEKRLRLRDLAGEGHEYKKWAPQYFTIGWKKGVHQGLQQNTPAQR